MTLKHAKTSGKSDGGDATLVQPSDWNADHVIDASGMDITVGSTPPAAPASGFVRMFGRSVASRAMPAFIGPSGLYSPLQPFFGRNKIGQWSWAGNNGVASGVSAIGIAAPGTVFGTSTARNVDTSNLFKSLRRNGWVSAATVNSRAGVSGGAQFWRGNGPGLGGFLAVFRFGCSDAAAVATARTMVGMMSSSAAGTAEPTAALNSVFLGTATGDTNLAIFYNDGTGSASKIDLGANFPDHTLSVDMYELSLFCAPNSDRIAYQVIRLNTGDEASGEITTDLPAATQLLLPYFHRTNGNTALAVGIDAVSFYIETDS